MSNGGQRNFDLLMTKISRFVDSVDDPSLKNNTQKQLRKEAIEALETLYGVLGWPLDKTAPSDEELSATMRSTEAEDLQRCTGGVPWS